MMMNFQRGMKYTRPDVKVRAGLAREAKGGNWDTGIVEYQGEFVLFVNVGTEGRTGHNYGNRWEGNCLRWCHKSGSHLGWSSVQRLIEPRRSIHVFWRNSNEAPFEYAGRARTVEIVDVSPVEILWSFYAESLAEPDCEPPVHSPEEVTRGEYSEGAVCQVLVNAYERDRAARQVCIKHYGSACAVCGLRFEDRYGGLGAGFIHVHHVKLLSELGPGYKLNPIQDLRPVCPNCHAMLHRQRPPLSVEALRAILREHS